MLACRIRAMHGSYVLGKIDSNGNNLYGDPILKELMKNLTFPSLHAVDLKRNHYEARLTWDGEVPFIR